LIRNRSLKPPLAGVSSYYFKKHDYKVQSDYRQIEFDEDPTLDNVEARVQLQLVV